MATGGHYLIYACLRQLWCSRSIWQIDQLENMQKLLPEASIDHKVLLVVLYSASSVSQAVNLDVRHSVLLVCTAILRSLSWCLEHLVNKYRADS